MTQGLVQWQKKLSDKQLPILMRTKTDVQALIDQSQLSVMQYAAPIVYDAGFSARIFRHVNTQRKSSGKNPLTTMGNVLSHLGQSAFQNFLDATPLLEDLDLPEKNIQGYMRVMGQACHASLQATDWALQRNVAETEETQLAALLQNTTELILWCYGGDVMPKIEELCYVNKVSYEKATASVLGCGMRELGSKLAAEWNLPEMAVDGLITKQDNFTLATGVSLASELSRIVALDWYGKNAKSVIQCIAKYKGKSEVEIERRLHLITVNVNDVLIARGYAAPAFSLFMLADDNYKYPQFILEKPEDENESLNKTSESETRLKNSPLKDTQKSTKSVDKAPVSREAILEKIKARQLAAKQAEEKPVKPVLSEAKPDVKPVDPSAIKNTAIKKADKERHASVTKEKKKITPANTAPVSKELAESIKEFKLMVSQAKPAHDLIEHIVKACLLCGVERSVFVIKLPNKDLLVSRYSAQVSEDIAIRSLKIPVNEPHVFKLLMEKSRNLFLNDSNSAKYWNFIPDSVKLAIGVRRFFAMSIFVNNHAMGLMYADKVKGELTQAEFMQFQGLCRLLSKGIIQSAHNKRK